MTAALERWGRLDTLVNNAGTTALIPHHDVEAATVDVWRRIFEVNVFGTWSMSVAALPALRDGDGGSIVNVASVAGVRPTGSSIPYAASKAALNHMTDAPGQGGRARGAGQRRGPGSGRHALDRGLGLRARGGRSRRPRSSARGSPTTWPRSWSRWPGPPTSPARSWSIDGGLSLA